MAAQSGNRMRMGLCCPTPPFPRTASTSRFPAALERADTANAAVAYRHERGRTMDDQLVAGLPLATLNTARQHHNRDEMADSPSGDIVAYGDATRSVALAHARSDEATYRERRFADEQFHDSSRWATPSTASLASSTATPTPGRNEPARSRSSTSRSIGPTPVYSGRRTALIQRDT